MKIDKRQLAVLTFFLLLLTPLLVTAVSKTTTWAMNDITTNSTNCTSVTEIGSGYSKTLQTLSFTNSSVITNSSYELKMLLRYGETSSVGSNSSWQQSTTFDASALSAKFVGVCFNTSSLNQTDGDTVDIDNLQLNWLPAGAIDSDTLEGLPYIGSDVGSFLKNLAPGVGAFIIILGVFAAIAGIIYAIVGIVKRKVAV